MVTWKSICQPKSMGGLGLRRFEDMNLALGSKIDWNVISEGTSMSLSILRAKYLNRYSLWHARPRMKDSFVWKGVLKTREIIKKGTCDLIGDEKSMDIWNYNWIPDAELSEGPNSLTLGSLQ